MIKFGQDNIIQNLPVEMFHRLMNYSEVESKPNVVLTREVIRRKMPRFKRHDDLIVIQEAAWEKFKKSLPMTVTKDKNTPFSVEEHELAFVVCKAIQKPVCRRLAIDKGVMDDEFRTPKIEILLGDDGVVSKRENHIIYEFDVTRCMYSFGNVNEKMRMARLNCSNEFVVDLFAGIGYFTLPLLVHAQAAHVYACEWNPEAVKALKRNLKLNKVSPDRCTIVEGDNRVNKPTDIAHRVIMGILPSSFDWLPTAYECIDKTLGATLHCHELVECKPTNIGPGDNDLNQHKRIDSNVNGNGSSNNDDTKDDSFRCDDSKHKSFSDEGHHLLNGSDNIKCDDNGNDVSFEKKSIERLDLDLELADDNLHQSDIIVTSGSVMSSTIIKEEEDIIEDLTNEIKDSSNDSNDTPPILLDYPTEEQQACITFTNESNSSNSKSSIDQNSGSSGNESMKATDHEMAAYRERAQQFVDRLKQEAQNNLNLTIKLVDIHVVKSYAPHINHVVFDIQIRPRDSCMKPL